MTITESDTMPVKVMERAEAAFYAGDIDALMTFYAPNSEGYTLAGGDSTGTGPRDRDKLRTGYAQFFKDYPKFRGKLVRSIEHGPYVVRQYASESGVPDPGMSLWIWEVRGGKIRRFWRAPASVPLER